MAARFVVKVVEDFGDFFGPDLAPYFADDFVLAFARWARFSFERGHEISDLRGLRGCGCCVETIAARFAHPFVAAEH